MGKPTFTISSDGHANGYGERWIGITELNKIDLVKRTRGTETSQYLEEKTSTEIPLVVASERGPGQRLFFSKQNSLERLAIVGDSPVCECDGGGLE
jgi:hypothetical protein